MKRSKATIKGIQELQAYNVRAIALLKPDGAVGRAIQYGAAELHRYVVAVTHVVTGSLRGTHRMRVKGERGAIFLDPGTTNPRTRTKPSIYGIEEHERGGSHAFYDRTVEERGKKVLEGMGKIVHQELRGG